MNQSMMRFRVIPAEDGLTLRSLLARRLPKLSKEEVLWLIHAGAVYVNRLRIRLGTVRMAAGERVTAYPQALQVPRLAPEDLRIVHRDPDFVIVDKPAGTPVDPTKVCAYGSISDALIQLLEQEGMQRPYVGVVHRLDQPASGLVLLTVRSAVNKSLHQRFVDHQIHRSYRALCWGKCEPKMTCSAPILENPSTGARVAEHGESGALSAQTDFELLEHRSAGASQTDREQSLVQATLHTGRHHQIRVHLAHLLYPIVGDVRYDPDRVGETTPESPDLLHLHAHRLEFSHPRTQAPICVESTLPAWATTQS